MRRDKNAGPAGGDDGSQGNGGQTGLAAVRVGIQGKILICLIASAVPFLTVALKYDASALPMLSAAQLVGYVMRTLVIFCSSLVVVFLVIPEEADRRKLFAIALSAPSYLSAALGTSVGSNDARLAALMNPVPAAHAESSTELGRWPRDSVFQQVYQGFTGQIPRTRYWIQLESTPSRTVAIAEAVRLSRGNRGIGYSFQAYPSYFHNGQYAVIMQGPFYSKAEAERALAVAKQRRLAPAPIIFSLPRAE